MGGMGLYRNKEIYGLNLQEKAAVKYKLKKRIMEVVISYSCI